MGRGRRERKLEVIVNINITNDLFDYNIAIVIYGC